MSRTLKEMGWTDEQLANLGQARVVLSCGCKMRTSGHLLKVGEERRCKQTEYSSASWMKAHRHPKVKSVEITARYDAEVDDYVALPGHEVW